MLLCSSWCLHCSWKMAGNDLRANEGRETKALNCKPTTNLKEISELSNYSKTSGFRLHAVRRSYSSRLIFTNLKSGAINLKAIFFSPFSSVELHINSLSKLSVFDVGLYLISHCPQFK